MNTRSDSLRVIVALGLAACLAALGGTAMARQRPAGKAGSASFEPEMVKIPGGTFQMGSEKGAPSERPVTTVSVSDFEMSRYEVTNDEFAAFVKDAAYRTEAEKADTGHIHHHGATYADIPGFTWLQWKGPGSNLEGRGRFPVVEVSYDDGVAYTVWLSRKTGKTYRLPTEAEWEYACRGGTKTEYWWGDTLDQTKINSRERWTNGAPQFAEDDTRNNLQLQVGSLPPNPFGLYEILGNVWEWASDYADPDYSKLAQEPSPRLDPKGPATGTTRVLKGGGWNASGKTDGRCPARYVSDPSTYRSDHAGLRVVRTVK
jgi:formylglycine-generating enzyme required for sulfatase activity